MNLKKRILVAPLNWGLGHATRCIPIIRALQINNFEPIIASDGNALLLLQKEFPNLEHLELPSYNITYPKNPKNFKWHFFKKTPHIIRTISKEKKVINQLIKSIKIDGIISDNRFGVYSKKIPSIYLTHQLYVLSGNTTKISTKWHHHFIKKFDECWIPDFENHALTGALSKIKSAATNVKYIGPLSRFQKQDVKVKYDVMLLLSGPEPQRSLLEHKLLKEFKNYIGTVILIRGIIEPKQTQTTQNNITVYNYMISSQLETAINESTLIVSRSGYTTIMDLVKLKKPSFFIPTPGQQEQEYLARHLHSQSMVSFCNQDEFSLEKLSSINNYRGFESIEFKGLEKSLFSLFESK